MECTISLKRHLPLWAEALRKFQQSPLVDPKRWDSLLKTISDCNDPDDVLRVFDGTVQKLKNFDADEPKWKDVKDKYLRPAIRAVLVFSDAIAEFASHFPTVPGGKAIFVAFGVLLQATEEVKGRCEILIGLFEELNLFLESLSVRLSMPSGLGPASKTVTILILAHLLDVFLIATKLFSQPAWRIRLTLFKDALLHDKQMDAALARLLWWSLWCKNKNIEYFTVCIEFDRAAVNLESVGPTNGKQEFRTVESYQRVLRTHQTNL